MIKTRISYHRRRGVFGNSTGKPVLFFDSMLDVGRSMFDVHFFNTLSGTMKPFLYITMGKCFQYWSAMWAVGKEISLCHVVEKCFDFLPGQGISGFNCCFTGHGGKNVFK